MMTCQHHAASPEHESYADLCHSLTASVPPQVIALAEAATPSDAQDELALAHQQLSDLQRQLVAGASSQRIAAAEQAALQRQRDLEQAERRALEEQLAQRLEDGGDFGAQACMPGCSLCCCYRAPRVGFQFALQCSCRE